MHPNIAGNPAYTDATRACVVATYAAVQHETYRRLLDAPPTANPQVQNQIQSGATLTGVLLRGGELNRFNRPSGGGIDRRLYEKALERWRFQEMSSAIFAITDALDGAVPKLNESEQRLGESLDGLLGVDPYHYASIVYVAAIESAIPDKTADQLLAEGLLRQDVERAIEPIAAPLIGEAMHKTIGHAYREAGLDPSRANLMATDTGMTL